MKILITYYTETGNTEKVAKSIGEGISGESPTVKAIKDVDVNSVADYDLVFLGAPVQGNSIPKVTKNFLKACPENCKVALFSTHGNSEQSLYAGFFKAGNKISGKKNITIVETFDCIGEIKNEQVIQMLKTAMPDKVEDMLKSNKGHPNESDLAKAKEFGKKVIEKLSVKAEL